MLGVMPDWKEIVRRREERVGMWWRQRLFRWNYKCTNLLLRLIVDAWMCGSALRSAEKKNNG
jgi:hypothetical protein